MIKRFQTEEIDMDAQSLASNWQRSRKTIGKFADGLDDNRIPYLSHSKLSLYEPCPRCYHKRYILMVPEEESEAMRRGQVFHRAAASLYASLRGKGNLPKPSQLLVASDRNILSTESIVLLQNAVALLRKHRWEDHEVISMEQPFFIDLARELPPIIGIPDLILRRNETWLFQLLEMSRLVRIGSHGVRGRRWLEWLCRECSWSRVLSSFRMPLRPPLVPWSHRYPLP